MDRKLFCLFFCFSLSLFLFSTMQHLHLYEDEVINLNYSFSQVFFFFSFFTFFSLSHLFLLYFYFLLLTLYDSIPGRILGRKNEMTYQFSLSDFFSLNCSFISGTVLLKGCIFFILSSAIKQSFDVLRSPPKNKST